MDDPLPENIDGTKRVVHSVEHSINWGYVAAAVTVLVVVAIVASRSGSDEPDGSRL